MADDGGLGVGLGDACSDDNTAEVGAWVFCGEDEGEVAELKAPAVEGADD